mgnify:CR=1 FL=1
MNYYGIYTGTNPGNNSRLKLSDFQSLAIMACKRLLYRSKFTHLGKHDLIFCPTRVNMPHTPGLPCPLWE